MRWFRLMVATILLGNPGIAAQKQFVYVGTYTGPESKGIYRYSFDESSGQLKPLGLGAEVVNPSFLTVSPDAKYLYSVTELGNDGKTEGRVSSYGINRATGALTPINSQTSRGGGACHLAVDHTGRMLIVANYGSGSVAAFPLGPDGSIGKSTALVQHEGSSVDPRRQRGPHAHAVVISADNRFVFVPDLGLDKIFSYRIDPQTGSLKANDPPFATVKAGLGPRHFAFHPNNRFAYAVDEMGSSVTAFRYDRNAGSLTEIQTISTLPPEFTGVDNSAEIQIDAKGRFLYASNRGDDSIAVFSIDAQKGTLRNAQRVSTEGKGPRNFRIDPSGRYLLAANQNSNNIVVFRVNSGTGLLKPTGNTAETHAPVCIQFVAPLRGGAR